MPEDPAPLGLPKALRRKIALFVVVKLLLLAGLWFGVIAPALHH